MRLMRSIHANSLPDKHMKCVYYNGQDHQNTSFNIQASLIENFSRLASIVEELLLFGSFYDTTKLVARFQPHVHGTGEESKSGDKMAPFASLPAAIAMSGRLLEVVQAQHANLQNCAFRSAAFRCSTRNRWAQLCST